MNETLIKFEKANPTFSWRYGLIQTGHIQKIDYNQIMKYKNFEDGFILVCEDVTKKKIVGNVCIGIRTIRYHHPGTNETFFLKIAN